MKTKIVHAFDLITRQYIGPVTLDDSDMSPMEPGVWHIPANCLDSAPPKCNVGSRLIADGSRWAVVPKNEGDQPELSTAERMSVLATEVQAHMDAVARSFGYDSLAVAISYADESAVPKFGGEGRAFRAWRSKVWAHVYSLGDLALDLGAGALLGALPALDILSAQAWAESAAKK